MKNFKPFISFIFISFIFSLILFILCNKDKSIPVIPQGPDIVDGPVEDTTRVYPRYYVDIDGTIVKVDSIPVYPKAIFARFYPWVKDTTKIIELAEKHHLRLYSNPSSDKKQLTALFCVTDDRRAEYHFTPYGKEGFSNFGTDSLVEYAFGVFGWGHIYPTGCIIFKFLDGTSQARIDSLLEANGLRLLHISPDFPTGNRYWTLVTPHSKKNVLDLGYQLQSSQSIPFLIYATTEIVTGYGGIHCDE